VAEGAHVRVTEEVGGVDEVLRALRRGRVPGRELAGERGAVDMAWYDGGLPAAGATAVDGLGVGAQ
jgi:hypothetical protein